MLRFLAAALLLFCSHLRAQNLFDEPHTAGFANYLYSSGQYKLAAQEYERLVFMNERNDSAKLLLLKSYRKAGDLDKGLTRLHDLYDTTFLTSDVLIHEWAYINVLRNDYALVETTLNHTTQTNLETKTYVLMNASLLQKRWKPALEQYNRGMLLDQKLFTPYQPVINEALTMKRRSPVVATGLSAVAPGLGKVYTGQWKDGIISLVMVGATAYQAYRGYEKKGFESPKFWAFGAVSTGFYLGNLYGSYKSAKKFNKRNEDEVVAKTRRLFMVGD